MFFITTLIERFESAAPLLLSTCLSANGFGSQVHIIGCLAYCPLAMMMQSFFYQCLPKFHDVEKVQLG
jgi:hypothetical protein